MLSRKICIPNIHRSHRGVTLIEIVIVVSIILILAACTFSFGTHDYYRYSFVNEQKNIISALQKARSQSVNNLCLGNGCTDGTPHGVHFETGAYVIFQGDTYVPTNLENERFTENSRISTIGVTEVVFAQLSGNATTSPPEASSLTVQDTEGHSSLISISTEGQISWTH